MAEKGHWYTDKNGNHYFVGEGQTPKEGWEQSKRRKMIDGGEYKVDDGDGNGPRSVSKDEYDKYEADGADFDATTDDDFGFDEGVVESADQEPLNMRIPAGSLGDNPDLKSIASKYWVAIEQNDDGSYSVVGNPEDITKFRKDYKVRENPSDIIGGVGSGGGQSSDTFSKGDEYDFPDGSYVLIEDVRDDAVKISLADGSSEWVAKEKLNERIQGAKKAENGINPYYRQEPDYYPDEDGDDGQSEIQKEMEQARRDGFNPEDEDDFLQYLGADAGYDADDQKALMGEWRKEMENQRRNKTPSVDQGQPSRKLADHAVYENEKDLEKDLNQAGLTFERSNTSYGSTYSVYSGGDYVANISFIDGKPGTLSVVPSKKEKFDAAAQSGANPDRLKSTKEKLSSWYEAADKARASMNKHTYRGTKGIPEGIKDNLIKDFGMSEDEAAMAVQAYWNAPGWIREAAKSDSYAQEELEKWIEKNGPQFGLDQDDKGRKPSGSNPAYTADKLKSELPDDKKKEPHFIGADGNRYDSPTDETNSLREEAGDREKNNQEIEGWFSLTKKPSERDLQWLIDQYELSEEDAHQLFKKHGVSENKIKYLRFRR